MARRIDYKITKRNIVKKSIWRNKLFHIVVFILLILLFILVSYYLIVAIFGDSIELPQYVSSGSLDNTTLPSSTSSLTNMGTQDGADNKKNTKSVHILIANVLNKKKELDSIMFFDYYNKVNKLVLYFLPQNFSFDGISTLSDLYQQGDIKKVTQTIYEKRKIKYFGLKINNEGYSKLSNIGYGLPVYIKALNKKKKLKLGNPKIKKHFYLKDEQVIKYYLSSISNVERQHRMLFIWLDSIINNKSSKMQVKEAESLSIDNDHVGELNYKEVLHLFFGMLSKLQLEDVRVYYPALKKIEVDKRKLFVESVKWDIHYKSSLKDLLSNYNELSHPMKLTIENHSGYYMDIDNLETILQKYQLEIVYFLEVDESANKPKSRLLISCYNWNKVLYLSWLLKINNIFDKFNIKYKFSDVILQIGNDFRIEEPS